MNRKVSKILLTIVAIISLLAVVVTVNAAETESAQPSTYFLIGGSKYDGQSTITMSMVADATAKDIKVYLAENGSLDGYETKIYYVVEGEENSWFEMVNTDATPVTDEAEVAELEKIDVYFEDGEKVKELPVAPVEPTMYTVTFVDDEAVVATVEVEEGKTVTELPKMNLVGFKEDTAEWLYSEGQMGDVFTTETVVNNNMTVVASKEPITYTVEFSDGVASQEVAYGKTAVEPVNPTPAAGYTFEYWTLDGEEYDFSKVVEDNLTLVAKFAKNETKYSVTTSGNENATPKLYRLVDGVYVEITDNKAEEGEVIYVDEAPSKDELYSHEVTYRTTSTAVEATPLDLTAVEGMENYYSFTMPAADAVVTVKYGDVRYAITSSELENGSIKFTVAGNEVDKAVAGATVTVVSTPAEGYKLSAGTVAAIDLTKDEDANTVAVTGDATFTMPAGAVEVSAEFELKDNNVTITGINAATGSVTSDKATAKMGETVTLTVTPISAEFALKELSVNDEKVDTKDVVDGEYAFTMPGEDVTITATFDRKYSATIKTGILETDGTVAFEKEAEEYEVLFLNDSVSFTVTPAVDRQIATITVKGKTTSFSLAKADLAFEDGKYTFEMPEDSVEINATFVEKEYTVTVPAAEDVIGGTLTSNVTTPHYNDVVTLTANPADGYRLVSLTYTIEGQEPVAIDLETKNFNMPKADITVNAVYEAENYNVKQFITMVNGALAFDKSSNVHVGDEVLVTVNPELGYKLKDDTLVVCDVEGTAIAPAITLSQATDEEGNVIKNQYTFPMPAQSVVLKAEFELATYTVSVNDEIDALTGALASDKATAKMGDTVTLTVTPVIGYELKTLTATANDVTSDVTTPLVDGEGNPVANKYVYTMGPADVEFNATFEIANYDVTLTYTSEEGTVVADKATAQYQDEVVLTITPATGYRLSSLKANSGAELKESVVDGEYTYTMINGNVEFVVLFEKIDYTLSLDAGNVGVTPAGFTGTKNYQDKVTFTVTAATAEYDLSRADLQVIYTVDEEDKVIVPTKTKVEGDVEYYEFTMPAYNVKLVAVAPVKTYTITPSVTGMATVVATVSGNTVTEAKKEDTVTITVTAASGYLLKTVTLAEDNGATFVIAGDKKSATLTDYTMPNNNLTVVVDSAMEYAVSKVVTVDGEAAQTAVANGVTYDPANAFSGATITVSVAKVDGKTATISVVAGDNAVVSLAGNANVNTETGVITFAGTEPENVTFTMPEGTGATVTVAYVAAE